MGLLNKIARLLSGSDDGEPDIYETSVRCSRCGEEIRVRVNLRRELTPRYEGGKQTYYVRKGVMGSGENRCFQTIEVRLTFDAQKRLISREVSGGDFVEQDDAAEGQPSSA